MQIRCSTCTKTIAIAEAGTLPPSCPHCSGQPVPIRLGAYVLDRLVATGGMGEVYLAHHDELGTEVAIKLLPAMPLDVLPRVRMRFAREARLTAKVAHPGVVRVLQSDVSGDRPFLVLEFVTGRTLRQRLADGPLPLVEAARLVAATGDVLAAAHARGVLHRDIKPDNIMVQDDGSVRVLDFGIARAVADDDAQLTRTGEIIGTPEYMAPEQLLDGPEATDARTDVHALGLLLYELATGRSPFRAANVFQALKLVESLVPQPLSRNLPAKPSARSGANDLDAVVAKAVAKRPGDRYPTAASFTAALRTAVPAARLPSPAPRGLSARRVWLIAATLIVFGLTMPLVAWLIATSWPQPRGDTTEPSRADAAAERATVSRRAAMRDDLRTGSWSRALATCLEDLDDGDATALPFARDAFVLSHAAWPRACELPAWLGAWDLDLRERLFGDLLEPGDGSTVMHRALLAGEPDAWRQWLETNATAYPTAVDLMRIREQDAATHADAFAACAQRLPIESPEHWLLRTIERHLRGDRTGSQQAAEMAWLSGGGELAVLLAAGLATLTGSGRAELQQSPAAGERIWRLAGEGDHADNPAGLLLQFAIECQVELPVRFDPTPAHAVPTVCQDLARSWCLTTAAWAEARERLLLLRVATALGAIPDFDAEPWRTVQDAAARSQLEQDATRGR